jgi:hypothetical protein
MNEIWERVLANSFSGIHKSRIFCSAYLETKTGCVFRWAIQQQGFAWVFILLTYLHVGQLLFADKKYLLLKRITVHYSAVTRENYVILKVKGPFTAVRPLSC